MKLRVGIDVGGTFTDVTVYDEDAGKLVAVTKYLSDPAQPAAVMETVSRELARDFGKQSVWLLLHGSTVALNTLLEGKGARLGLLTTSGFRDVYEIGRQWRGEDVFNLFAPGPAMLLTRDRIYEIQERLDASGQIIQPLQADDVAKATQKLLTMGVEAVAVCFLFAYANPVHELAAAHIIRALAPDLHVSLSHEVNPEWREYERTAATVADAYIAPPVSRALRGLEQVTLQHLPRARNLMMKSDGGVASLRMLARTPLKAVMSGPVAGVIAARRLGDVKGIEKLISFDAGGTSSDMAVIPGAPLYKSEITVGRHPLRTHAVDIATIGAGGGSIASVELGGVLKVGPRSAGANPGPACYGRGGTEPTLTDALVLLGHLNPTALLDGAMPIASENARAAVLGRVAQPLGMPEMEAAWGILRVVATSVMLAMRTITVERGYDPREFTLIPFGGMGPAMAGLVAAETGIARILIPRDPGTFSAYGLLVTDARHERSFTHVTAMNDLRATDLDALFAQLETKALEELAQERFPSKQLVARRQAGMRYRGQSYEVMVDVGTLAGPQDVDDLITRFHAAHQRQYGHMAQAEAVEIVNFQVAAIALMERPQLQKIARCEQPHSKARTTRSVSFSGTDGFEAPVWHRDDLIAGMHIEGPAIIEEKTSTIVLYPGQRAAVDEYLNIDVHLG